MESPQASAELEQRFAEFVATHREPARRMAWRLVGGESAAADDVAQEAFVAAWRGLDRFRQESSLSTWFYSILVRQASRHRRWRGVREAFRRSQQAVGPEAPPPRRDPGLQRRIAAGLDGLTRSQREAFVLVHLEGFTVRECAAVLGKAEGTIKSHLHRALAHLRRELADLRDGAEDHA